METTKIRAWIGAARPRTLPLALASIAMGSFLAAFYDVFRWEILLLAGLTTIFLQILSNLANDYGDSKHGADSEHREGPLRAVQSGTITSRQMLGGIILFVALSLVSGILLLYVSFGMDLRLFAAFLGLGIVAIIAAYTYTAGNRPYGYFGLGDISVLIFFGLIGVLGTFFLHARFFQWSLLLPAITCGFFSMAVLNINNIRDIESDRKAGKLSIPVRLGRKLAIRYHWILLLGGIVSAGGYMIMNFNSWWQFLFIITIPMLIRNGLAIQRTNDPVKLDPFLKQMAVTTLIFVITFGIGLVFSV